MPFQYNIAHHTNTPCKDVLNIIPRKPLYIKGLREFRKLQYIIKGKEVNAMNPPDGLSIKMYLTLLKLYAEQNNVRIAGEFEVDGVRGEFDTNDPTPSYKEIVERYGKTKKELERESNNLNAKNESC